MRTHKSLVIATASRSRRQLLENAGVTFEALATNVDESAIKATALAEGLSVEATALALAGAKARAAQQMYPNSLIIGADQMLDCGGRWLDKPDSLIAAGNTLRLLRGKSHDLVTSVSVVHEGKEIWALTDRAKLLMRDFSDDFLDTYLSNVGDDVMLSVGAYQLEGLGAQLFERIDGDYFTILGLPLLPLLGFLRDRNVIGQ